MRDPETAPGGQREAELERQLAVAETMLKNQQQQNQSLDWHLTEVVKENEFLGGPLWAKNPTVDAVRKQLAEARAGLERVSKDATQLNTELVTANLRAERLAGLLERAKPEIYLDSHGNPELVREIEEALARKEG